MTAERFAGQPTRSWTKCSKSTRSPSCTIFSGCHCTASTRAVSSIGLDRLDDPVRRPGDGAESGRHTIDGLVVDRVDGVRRRPVRLGQPAARFDLDRVARRQHVVRHRR